MIIRTKDAAIEYEQDTSGVFQFTEGGPTLLLDGDPIAYSSASACDSAEHNIKLNGTTIYTIQGGLTELYSALGFTDYRDFGSMLEKNPDITYEKVVTSDDSRNMFHTIKAQIRKIIKRTGAGAVKVYLTDGATNFRITEDIATVLKYKGNRSSESKPQMLGKARDYMVEELGAIMCSGYEADDALAVEHRNAWKQAMEDAVEFYAPENVTVAELEKKAMELSETILCTIDKDIKMVAGKFLNPDQDLGIENIYPLGSLFLEVKSDSKKLRFNGLKGFYAQLLLGDNCDNISSVYFCGDTRTYEVLKDCENEEQLFKATLREIYQGFHREHLKTLDSDILSRVEIAISSGAHGNDNPSNRAKVKKKIKDAMDKTVAYGGKYYYHWSLFKEKEDGTVSRELADPTTATLSYLSPVDYMVEVARLIYMLDVYPDGCTNNHLWKFTPEMEKWAAQVTSEFEEENLMRISTEWVL
jgi:hypothetical protein